MTGDSDSNTITHIVGFYTWINWYIYVYDNVKVKPVDMSNIKHIF